MADGPVPVASESPDASNPPRAARGAISGAAGEAGSHYRASVAALIAAHGIAGQPVTGFDLGSGDNAVPETVQLETDDDVDDIACTLPGGERVLLQAKRSLDFTKSKETGIGSVATQWRAAVADGPLPSNLPRLIAVTQNLNGTGRSLRDALRRRRGEIAGAMSGPETTAMKKLGKHLANLGKDRLDSVLDAIRIWELKVEDEADAGADVGRLLLRGVLADETETFAAWRDLIEDCKYLARTRQGRSRDGFIERLRDLGYALKPDAPGSLGARRSAIGRYRQSVLRRGRTLDFLGLGSAIPPLPIEDVDARVRASSSAASRDTETANVDLAWGLRRRGRVLLTGLPGGGKSTAIRIAAATWAEHGDWPLPVVVQLHRLARRREERSLRDALLELAVEDCPLADRPAVTAAIEDGLADASATLFLDGLDEARERRHDLARELRDFVAGLHPDTEVLVSTRDVAYADGAIFGFAELRLVPPQHPEDTVRGILRALADAGGHDRTWVTRRADWIGERLGRDPALKETPLLPVILTVLAARNNLDSLPSSRAELLRLAVRETVAQWESGRPGATATLGPLSGARAAAALTDAFIAEAAFLSVADSVLLRDVLAGVAHALREGWQLSPADAGAAAEEAVSFWDESGFFVMQGADHRVAPRIRLFAEVGEAWRIAQLAEDAQREWVRQTVHDENRHEAIRLAAGLSSAVADELTSAAAQTADFAMLRFAAETQRESARVSDQAVSALIEALGDGLAAEAGRWERAVLLAELPAVAPAAQARIDELLDTYLAPRQRAIAAALAVLVRDDSGPDADAVLETVLQTDPPERESEPPRADDGVLHFLTVDQPYMRAKLGAARALFPRRPEVAELVASAIEHASVGAVGELESLLIAGGRRDLVEARRKREAERLGSFASQWKDHREAERAMWMLISNLADPAELGAGERRRLDALVDFWQTLELPSAAAFEPGAVLAARPDETRFVMETVARVAGFDLPTLAAEAKLCLEAEPGEDGFEFTHMLYDGGSPRALSGWKKVHDKRAACAQLVPALGIGQWLSHLAASLLLSAGDNEASDEIEATISAFRPHNRILAGIVSLGLDAENEERRVRFQSSDDPMLRAAAGHVAAGMLMHDGSAYEGVAAALADRDGTVREAALRRLDADGLPEGALPSIEAATKSEPDWTCSECGTANEGARTACEQCSRTAPESHKKAIELHIAATASGANSAPGPPSAS